MSTKQRGATTTDLKTLGSRLEATIKENTREIVAYFNASQGAQNKWIKERFEQIDERFEKVDQRLEQMDAKLDAIMSGEVLVTKNQLLKLIRELKAKGIELDESRIFARP